MSLPSRTRRRSSNPSTQNITSTQPATLAVTSPAVPLSIDAGL